MWWGFLCSLSLHLPRHQLPSCLHMLYMHAHTYTQRKCIFGWTSTVPRCIHTHCPRIYSVNVDLTSQKAQKLTPQCHVLQLSSSPEILWTTKATIRQGILGQLIWMMGKINENTLICLCIAICLKMQLLEMNAWHRRLMELLRCTP